MYFTIFLQSFTKASFYALQAEGHRFESCCSHPQNQPLTTTKVSGFFMIEYIYTYTAP